MPRGTKPPLALPFQRAGEFDIGTTRSHVVAGLLSAATLAVLFGEPGAGKSYIALHLALAIARGGPFLGHSTNGGAALYLACEGADGLANSIAAARQSRDFEDDLPLGLVRGGVALNGRDGGGALSVVETIRALEEKVGKPCRLVIVDTLARTLVEDENSSADMGQFISACEQICENTGVAFLAIHHSGKNPSKGGRGSSALLGAADTELAVAGGRTVRTLRVTK